MSGDKIDDDTGLLAAVAYGEASTANDPDEIGGIAFTVANRCRAWNGKTVTNLKASDPNYAYAWNGTNQRFNKFMKASVDSIKKDAGMSSALDWAKAALENKGTDPSNGALFWDGFKYGDPLHDIFSIPENKREIIVRWKIKNNKTGKIIDGAERGRYDAVWVSTAAHGNTILWKHPDDYLEATGGKEYR